MISLKDWGYHWGIREITWVWRPGSQIGGRPCSCRCSCTRAWLQKIFYSLIFFYSLITKDFFAVWLFTAIVWYFELNNFFYSFMWSFDFNNSLTFQFRSILRHFDDFNNFLTVWVLTFFDILSGCKSAEKAHLSIKSQVTKLALQIFKRSRI